MHCDCLRPVQRINLKTGIITCALCLRLISSSFGNEEIKLTLHESPEIHSDSASQVRMAGIYSHGQAILGTPTLASGTSGMRYSLGSIQYSPGSLPSPGTSFN